MVALPLPERIRQVRREGMPSRQLSVQVIGPEIQVAFGNDLNPEMVAFSMPAQLARKFFSSGLHMCDWIEGEKYAPPS